MEFQTDKEKYDYVIYYVATCQIKNKEYGKIIENFILNHHGIHMFTYSFSMDSIPCIVKINSDEFTGEADIDNAEYDLIEVVKQEIDDKAQEILSRLPEDILSEFEKRHVYPYCHYEAKDLTKDYITSEAYQYEERFEHDSDIGDVRDIIQIFER